jgi:hypothetical protein
MSHTAKLRERLLKLQHLGSEDELSMIEHARDCKIDSLACPLILGGQIDKHALSGDFEHTRAPS